MQPPARRGHNFSPRGASKPIVKEVSTTFGMDFRHVAVCHIPKKGRVFTGTLKTVEKNHSKTVLLRAIVPRRRKCYPSRAENDHNRRLGCKNMSELVHVHPLVFTLHDVVTGCGFIAGIVVTGKAVMEQEDGKWWMYGVCPGSVAGSGETPNEAFIDFRTRYKETLFDMAEEFQNFVSFDREVREFYNADDPQENARWEEGLRILRECNHSVTESFQKLPKWKPGDYKLGIHIDRLEKMQKSELKPANNVQDSLAKAA